VSEINEPPKRLPRLTLDLDGLTVAYEPFDTTDVEVEIQVGRETMVLTPVDLRIVAQFIGRILSEVQ
jgi:hypothetical protein